MKWKPERAAFILGSRTCNVFSTQLQRVASNCGKYDRGLTYFRRHVLHWMDVTDRIRFRLCIQVYKCRRSMAPGYLIDLCQPVASIDGRGHLRSASRGQLQIPQVKMATYGNRAFEHAGPYLERSAKHSQMQFTLFTYFQTSSETFLLLVLLAHQVHSKLLQLQEI